MMATVRPLTAALMIGFTVVFIIAVVAYEMWKDRQP